MDFHPSVRAKYIVLGEVNIVVNALVKAIRWATHSYLNDHEDPLITSFNNLQNTINRCDDLNELDALVYLTPFLNVIRSEETSGPITSHALTSLNKFIVYDLINLNAANVVNAVSSIADAVTHARFVGTDPSSDEVVLSKILQVLRALLLQSIGSLLTNEAVCEIMQSCFRICFETRLSDLLRKTAEHTLEDMIRVLFTRLPSLKDDCKTYPANSMRKLKMRAGGMEASSRGKRNFKRQTQTKPKKSEFRKINTEEKAISSGIIEDQKVTESVVGRENNENQENLSNQTPKAEVINEEEDVEKIAEKEEATTPTTDNEQPVLDQDEGELADSEMNTEKEATSVDESDKQSQLSENGSIQDNQTISSSVELGSCTKKTVDDVDAPLVPYSLPCVRELFRFLISLINPHDSNNMDHMNQMGMALLTVALEVSRDEMNKFPSILSLIKDDMCRYLFQLLNVEKITLVASALRVSLLLLESLRKDLKFQLETFLKKLMELISNEQSKFSYELKELALKAMMQLWHIPSFVTELYLNYDCDFYCSNIFDDLSKLLSKNAFPVSGLYPTHLLSLDALLTVIRSIEHRCNLPSNKETVNVSTDTETQDSSNSISLIPDRFLSELPTVEELREIKKKKKILLSGTEQFNQKPTNGISFLQKANMLDIPLDARQVTRWLRDNPWLDKAKIGEYLSDRRFPELLPEFVRTFKFEGLRIDEGLRLYLETFRLPGEAPVIARLITAFSDYWSECNHHPFKDTTTAFVLSYAVIMLNTDQHNRNVRKQHKPMSLGDFLVNTKKAIVKDYDKNMLEEIYATIKNDEIVLPEEQTGFVRDKWLWNVLIRRGTTKEGTWLSAPLPSQSNDLSLYDTDLFAMSWGSTVSALSYVFDKSQDENIIQKAITGFKKCALISANFGMSQVFDNLMVSLCKFTGLSNTTESADMSAIMFGSNPKSQLAARTALSLAHRHGDILREGWRNILDIILPLFRAKLLSAEMVEGEDFVVGTITLLSEEPTFQRPDSLFNSIYQFMASVGGPGDNSAQKQNTPEDQEALRHAQECVEDLQLENLVTESKFLRLDSLQELLKALMLSSRAANMYGSDSRDDVYSEDSAIFYLELLLRVVLQNKDRIVSLWQVIRDHLYTIIVMATEYSRMLERAVIGLLRIAIRLLHREDVSEEILASLQILIMIKSNIIPRVSRQIAFGLDNLLRENAANIHLKDDWVTIFTIMKCVGAGSLPPPIMHMSPDEQIEDVDSLNYELDRKTQSDSETVEVKSTILSSDRGYTSDSEVYDNGTTDSQQLIKSASSPKLFNGLILKFHKIPDDKSSTHQIIPPPPNPCNQFTLQLGEELHQHDMKAMVKCCETLAFLVRDINHITPDNFELCVRCIRTFAEASINGVNRTHHNTEQLQQSKLVQDKKKLKKRKERDNKRKTQNNSIQASGGRYATSQNSDDELSYEAVPDRYHTLSLQLLDLMHTLHTNAGQIYRKWESDEKVENEATTNLWDKCWCPLLQGMARLCCDARRQVRQSAFTFLQRALLNHDLHNLTGKEWESCFNKVLFPLLTKLLENVSPVDPEGMEETRMRGSTLLSKVFLQHLTPLLNLPTFTALWLTILDFMDKYMHIGKRDLLFEAIPESLKNMLLVMHTNGIFHSSDTVSGHTSLWDVTWERINFFLPNLKNEIFKSPSPEPKKSELVAPKPAEVIRDSALQMMPAPGPFPVTPLVGEEITAPPAGIIPTQIPKLTPPSSLNTMIPTGLPATSLKNSASTGAPVATNILMNSSPPTFMVHPLVAAPAVFQQLPTPVPTSSPATDNN